MLPKVMLRNLLKLYLTTFVHSNNFVRMIFKLNSSLDFNSKLQVFYFFLRVLSVFNHSFWVIPSFLNHASYGKSDRYLKYGSRVAFGY